MKRLLVLLFFLIITPAFAEESNTQIQKSTSVINSSANGGSTDVTVDNNGNVTHYSSNSNGSVSVKSVNGQSSITVNGETVSPTPYLKPQATPSISPNLKNNNHPKSIKSKFNINLFDFLKKIFSFI